MELKSNHYYTLEYTGSDYLVYVSEITGKTVMSGGYIGSYKGESPYFNKASANFCDNITTGRYHWAEANAEEIAWLQSCIKAQLLIEKPEFNYQIF